MRIVVTGASGFIGRALVDRLLLRRDEVIAFTRRAPSEAAAQSGLSWVQWNPEADGAWQDSLEAADAVVHLAGETAVGRRYTPEVEARILASRVETTARIVAGIERAARRPEVFVCASGVGYFGNHDDDAELSETSAPGNDFLARVCVAWEAAAQQAAAYHVRVVSARFGFVLGRDGGGLAKMIPIFKSFVGGPMGTGKQIVPWIHIADVVGALVHMLSDTSLRGPVNVVAPNAVTNAEFSKSLGRALGRPALIPAPGFALRALFGEGADPLLGGQRAVPRALFDHGYSFRFTHVDAALRDLVRE